MLKRIVLGAIVAIGATAAISTAADAKSSVTFGFSFGGPSYAAPAYPGYYVPYYQTYGYTPQYYTYGYEPAYQVAPTYGYDANAHIAWCQQRFRSYNVSTDSYLGYDGYYHRCEAPY